MTTDGLVLYWPTRHSRSRHYYVSGAMTGDGSLCGIPLRDESRSGDYSQYDPICLRCSKASKTWEPAKEGLIKKPRQAKTKLKPLPVLKAKRLNWDQVCAQGHIGGLKIVAYNSVYMMLEEPPTQRLYWYRGQPYQLWMPWLYYHVRVSDYSNFYKVYKFYCSNTQVTKPTQRLYKTPFPNQYNFGLCYVGSASRLPASEGIVDAITIWWNQNANNDAFPSRSAALNRLKEHAGLKHNDPIGNRRKYFETWEKLSLDEVLKITWTDSRQTVQSLFGSTGATIQLEAA